MLNRYLRLASRTQYRYDESGRVEVEQEKDLLHGTAESRGEVGGRIVFEIFSAFVGAEAVKALKGGEAAAKTADTIGDVSGALSKTEKIADVSKAADKAADVSKVADEIADASKTADKISDTAELAEDAGKVADKVAVVVNLIRYIILQQIRTKRIHKHLRILQISMV